MIGIAFFTIYLLTEFIFIKIAQKFNISDIPNNRSSHQIVTIRGGGIIFPVAVLVPLIFQLYFEWITFSLSLFIITALSFIDDIKNLSSTLRLAVQSITIIGLLYSLNDSLPWYLLALCFVIITGIINAYNFMDGINGITALYSLVTIGTLYYVYSRWTITHQQLWPDIYFISMLAALLVFSFFNVRKKAICFAGDVGSVSMAFIICFLLLKLIIDTGSIWWLCFLSVYGIDTLFTIFCRMLRKEILMQAHRSHFYQWLTNEAGWTHLQVSGLYAGVQLGLNALIIYEFFLGRTWIVALILFVIILIYTIFRVKYEGFKRLFLHY